MKSRLYKNKEWLKKHYVDKGMSAQEIGRMLGRSHHTIIEWLDIHGLPKRTMKEAFNTQRSRAKRSGRNNPCWKGGVRTSNGRVFVKVQNHPNADCWGYVARSRLVAEKALGRYLESTEPVHHINRKKDDDRNANLLICNNEYHARLHAILDGNSNTGRFAKGHTPWNKQQ